MLERFWPRKAIFWLLFLFQNFFLFFRILVIFHWKSIKIWGGDCASWRPLFYGFIHKYRQKSTFLKWCLMAFSRANRPQKIVLRGQNRLWSTFWLYFDELYRLIWATLFNMAFLTKICKTRKLPFSALILTTLKCSKVEFNAENQRFDPNFNYLTNFSFWLAGIAEIWARLKRDFRVSDHILTDLLHRQFDMFFRLNYQMLLIFL